jgi:hypothetical protein
VRVEDVEAAASVHQHLGEPRVANDRVDDQWILARVGDAVDIKSAPHAKHTASRIS